MSVVTIVLAFALALGPLIVVHEFGHYWVARRCGVKVVRFSVGFGRPILSKRYGEDGTEWALGAFPLGGYVKMLDEREGPVAVSDLPRAFNRQPVGKRIAIVLAGPSANFIAAILLTWLLFVVGMPGAKPIIDAPLAKSVAEAAGFKPGEQIVGVEGEAVATWREVRWLLIDSAVDKRVVLLQTVDDGGRRAERALDMSGLSAEDLDGDFLDKLGLTQRSPYLPAVGRILADGAAQHAGLREGDEITAINGERIRSWEQVVRIVQANPGNSLRFEIQRGNASLLLPVTPSAAEDKAGRVGRIGAAPKVDESLFTETRYGLGSALARAAKETWRTSIFTLKMLGKMVMGAVSWKNLSGPITIAKYAGEAAQIGWIPFVTMVAFLSISLGVLNLLPIPLLDGGHLMYYIVELIKGGPVPERIMEIGQQIGMAILLGLMLFAFYNDINRLITG